jgi:hypothetical protein
MLWISGVELGGLPPDDDQGSAGLSLFVTACRFEQSDPRSAVPRGAAVGQRLVKSCRHQPARRESHSVEGRDGEQHSFVLLSRGLNRSAVGKTGVSFTSRRPQQLAPSNLTSLLACTDALCRAILGHGYARRRARSSSALRGRPALFPKRAPYPFIQSPLKQKLCPSRLRPPRLHPQGRPGLS